MRSIRFFGKCFQQIKSIKNFCAKRKKETNERKKGNKGHGGYQQGIWHSLPLDKYQVCIVFTFTGCALYLTIKHVLSRAIRSFRGTIDSRSVQLSLCYRSVFRILSAATREINSLPREKYQKWRGDTKKRNVQPCSRYIKDILTETSVHFIHSIGKRNGSLDAWKGKMKLIQDYSRRCYSKFHEFEQSAWISRCFAFVLSRRIYHMHDRWMGSATGGCWQSESERVIYI